MNDPFAELEDSMNQEREMVVHVRVQKRNGKKCVTTVQGLDPNLDFKKILKTMKRVFCCNGSIESDPNLGDVLQMSGDMRQNVCEFLTQELQINKTNIKIHGF